ncbi:MAG TPA: glycosyltransferase family 39 protein, partial [Isosphaeraceae bacterium]|nr:glycosyltransferase family 39 protein [Isosphaeraceae bacterium]
MAPAPSGRRFTVLGIGLLALLAAGAWADIATGGRWLDWCFDQLAHFFYEQPLLAAVRRPGQLVLFRAHLAIALALAACGLVCARGLSGHGRRLWVVFWVAYAIRATIWTIGGNLPLVPGDSSHYIEVATSIYRGEGPVKHYVESYFRDYPAIRAGRGVLDDWATPLYSYVLAAAYRLTGVNPGESLEQTVAVAKGVSFLCNLLALPVLYGLARRRLGMEVALAATAALAILPVHALYAGFALRESFVALTALLAIWFLTELWSTTSPARWAWAVACGLAGGLAILVRNTSMALMAAAWLYGVFAHGKRHFGPLLVAGAVIAAVISPWAWATFQEYGEPFYTYTKYFQYNFSWTVHHYTQGTMRAADFYTWANAPEIVRVKLKSLAIIVVYTLMILSPPLV